MKSYDKFPLIRDKNIELMHFPTAMQALIFRMWERIPTARLAEVLETSEENILEEGERMGLSPQKCSHKWYKKGYITILRSVWHILPYEQILALLGWDEERLMRCLMEEDGLKEKLGDFKPQCKKVVYQKLTDQEKRETLKIKETMLEQIHPLGEARAEPFDFYGERYARMSAGKENSSTMFDVIVDSDWKIENAAPEAEFFVDMFAEGMNKSWGNDIRKGKGEKRIEIRTDKTGKTPEYPVPLTAKHRPLQFAAYKTYGDSLYRYLLLI